MISCPFSLSGMITALQLELPDKALTSALFFFLFPEKSRTCGDKCVEDSKDEGCIKSKITACIQKESKRSEKRHGHQKRVKRVGKDDLVSMTTIRG